MTPRPEARAQKLLDELAINSIPIPVEKLARACNTQIRYRRFDGDISGLLLREDDGEVIIGVHAQHARVRQRFTIAHELGHKVLHKGRPVIVEHLHRSGRVNFRDGTSALASDREEIEANQFAAGVLMPRSLVESAFDEQIVTLSHDRIVAILARKFEVSEQAMRFRLMNLALVDPM
jgi:Zn-dependent peptidase ImmA (M78 family)